MRIWIDPEKLKARNLTTAGRASSAIREQNVQVAAGQVGQPPAPQGQNFQYTITALGRLSDPEQFGDIIIKTGEGDRGARYLQGRRPRGAGRADLRPVRAEERPSRPPASPSSSSPGPTRSRSAEQVAGGDGASCKPTFPRGLDYAIPFDTTIFVQESIDEVYKTLFEAGVLVLIVILVFLQDWRAS